MLNKLAEEPELTKTLYFTPSHFDHFFSNSKNFLRLSQNDILFFNNFCTSLISEIRKISYALMDG